MLNDTHAQQKKASTARSGAVASRIAQLNVVDILFGLRTENKKKAFR
jgi:DNA-binding MurR/RpiR family transcriptional regulator